MFPRAQDTVGADLSSTGDSDLGSGTGDGTDRI